MHPARLPGAVMHHAHAVSVKLLKQLELARIQDPAHLLKHRGPFHCEIGLDLRQLRRGVADRGLVEGHRLDPLVQRPACRAECFVPIRGRCTMLGKHLLKLILLAVVEVQQVEHPVHPRLGAVACAAVVGGTRQDQQWNGQQGREREN